MLSPYFVARNMFDELVDSAFSGHNTTGLMKTDIKETESSYELAIDLPGVRKEDLSAELKDNYLCISATVGQANEENRENSRYLRRERFVGTVRRSFYVGERIQRENIRARFEDGTLYLSIPKEIPQPQVEQKNLIAIEG
ncbi:MAG: Hsp20/alpha crystallin family protein [Oscillospiraceae bacterium]